MDNLNPQTDIEKKGVKKIRRNRMITFLLGLFFMPSIYLIDSFTGPTTFLRNYGILGIF